MKIFRRPIPGALLLCVLAAACSGSDEASAPPARTGGGPFLDGVQQTAAPAATPETEQAAREPAMPTQADTGSSGAAPPPRMIIRTGSATVRVRELEPAIGQVRRMAERLGGYVANTSVHGGVDERKTATLELKIPAARFNQAVEGLSPIGRLEQQQTTSEDVGEQYTDIAARMANARRLEERLLGLLETRTGRLEDVLAVERELARVREEIERAEGRLRYLRTRVSLSTLTVHLREGGYNPVGQAFREAWRNLVEFVAGLISALGWLIPLLIVIAILWRFVRWLFRRRGPDARPWWRRPDPPPPPGG